MSLKTRMNGEFTYLKIKNGKIYRTSDKELTEPFDSLSGKVIDIGIKEETYQNQPSDKLFIVMESEDGVFNVSMMFEGSYSTTLLNFLLNCDLSQPVEISPSQKDVEGKDGKSYKQYITFVRQNGAPVKSYFSEGNPGAGTQPSMNKVKVSGKTMWDKTDFLNHYKKLINEQIKPSLSGRDIKNTVTKTVSIEPEVEEVTEDDLPF